MSPVEPAGPGHVGRAATVSVVAIVLLFGALWLVTLVLKDRNSPDLRLGDQTYVVGNTEGIASSIADHGPLLLPDVSGRKDRNVILQHVGQDPKSGWYAFLANPPDRDQSCTWEWKPDENLFRAKCDPSLTAPADGKGLEQYQVTVGEKVEIDLNAEARAAYEKDRGPATTTEP